MGYRRQKSYSRYNNRFATAGGFDSTGRWRSEAWHMDGGANDEGWHQAYCNRCGKVTEHGRGSGCVPCGDRRIAAKNRPKAKANSFNTDWKAKEAVRLDRMAAICIYEVNAGSLPQFLESLKEQLSKKKNLSAKQIEVGAKVLAGIVEQDIIDRVWSRTSPRKLDAEFKIGSIVRMKYACDPRVVTGKNCPYSRRTDEFEVKSMYHSNHANWISDTENYVVIK